MSSDSPEISVIIPALNEERYIMNALRGLENQTFRNFETIVVDGGSNDRTTKIARKHARVIIERRRGIARARNKGARIARGGVLVFLDADTEPARNLLMTYSRAFDDHDLVAATGPILPLERTGPDVNIGYAFVSVFFVKLSMLLGFPAFVGANFAVRREAFEKVGGFNPSLMTYEDWNLANKLKRLGRMRFIDSAAVHTSVRRIEEWGVAGFFGYHVGNIIRYNLFKKPKSNYIPVR